MLTPLRRHLLLHAWYEFTEWLKKVPLALNAIVYWYLLNIKQTRPLIHFEIRFRTYSRSWASLPETSSGLFSSLKRDLEVSRVEEPDQEIVRQRREMLKNKSVSDLAQIGSLTDFPVPEVFQNMVGTSKRAKSVEKNRWVGGPFNSLISDSTGFSERRFSYFVNKVPIDK